MNNILPIIPKPLSYTFTENQIPFNYDSISIQINLSTPSVTDRMKTAFSLFQIPVSDNGFQVNIEIKNQNTDNTDESYSLNITINGINIKAENTSGAFYGCVSAAQIIFGSHGRLPELTIEDKPLHSWRGFLLDTSRSFYSTVFIKKILDACAIHKINIFHWHLTDDQGWRFEVPGYPKLTETGSKRQAQTMPPSEDGVFDEGEHVRRWYTDEEIKEIVTYAQERCIQIVPEVEFPGHSSALLASYPEYGCTGGPYQVENRWGIFPDVLCLGKNDVFTIYKAALTKIAELFPSPYIHIGGDECPHERWQVCPKCQARIKKEGLESVQQLQAWGTTKIAAMVNSLGKTPVGWDEVLDNNEHNPLPDNVIVQSWRGTEGAKKAVSLKHKAIISPCEYYYLNFKNKKSFEEPGRLGVTTTKKVYDFTPAKEDLILGAECALWTEMLPHSRVAEYLLFPRFCAAAETFWLPENKKDFNDFEKRLEYHKKLLSDLDYLFYNGELC